MRINTILEEMQATFDDMVTVITARAGRTDHEIANRARGRIRNLAEDTTRSIHKTGILFGEITKSNCQNDIVLRRMVSLLIASLNYSTRIAISSKMGSLFFTFTMILYPSLPEAYPPGACISIQ